ncbi:hypothetical protein VIBNISOn1_p0138 [Vibrio nigripulchritudo SOn1]|uniref:Transposase n=1 Tax=Vibrio nigripulchritudo SOn1 TaxID=1238450 RepID=A0AAV2W1M4_9VIBR|nr:hypothetical protein VIBNISOn1_p0138 [Vibrio nigripulchritudo SOn1]
MLLFQVDKFIFYTQYRSQKTAKSGEKYNEPFSDYAGWNRRKDGRRL